MAGVMHGALNMIECSMGDIRKKSSWCMKSVVAFRETNIETIEARGVETLWPSGGSNKGVGRLADFMEIKPIQNSLPNIPNCPPQKVILRIEASGVIIRLNEIEIATHNCAQTGRETEKGGQLFIFSSRVARAVAGTSGEIDVDEKKTL